MTGTLAVMSEILNTNYSKRNQFLVLTCLTIGSIFISIQYIKIKFNNSDMDIIASLASGKIFRTKRMEILNDSTAMPIRGPGDSKLPFRNISFSHIKSLPMDLNIEKPKGIDPPDPYNPPLKKILFWNDFFGLKHFGMGFGREPFIRAGCPVSTCMTTGDRERFPPEEIDALVWHLRSGDKSFPAERSPHTRYIFFLMESPVHRNADVVPLLDVFNWTSTYKLDSDFKVTYGGVYRSREPLEVPEYKYIIANKTKLAAWFVSNCQVSSGRQTLVAELQKFIAVDIYGACGKLKCPRSQKSNTCFKMLERDYKFYFSFENSLCKDYITEKFFGVLKINIVPVVYGFGNYSAMAPPHSYIDALDFPSAEALADYLLYLDKNDTAYEEYFTWKKYHIHRNGWGGAMMNWCDLCERLHTDNTTKTYDMQKWFVEDSYCTSGPFEKAREFLRKKTNRT